MEIKQIALSATVYEPRLLPCSEFPKIVFLGRSNVGKSSLINTLLQRKGLAKTSQRPGKTISVNYYRVNDRFDLVDLPGYGYSRLPDADRLRVRKLIDGFFSVSRNIRLFCLLVDCRRGFQDTDLGNLETILEKKFPLLTILTKSDKLSFSKLKNQIIEFNKTYGLIVIPFSILSKMGHVEIWGRIDQALKE